jgi:hypothetical protein
VSDLAEFTAAFDHMAEPPAWTTKRMCLDPIDALSTEPCACGDPDHRQVKYVTRGGSRSKLMCVAIAVLPTLLEWLWRSSDVAEAASTLMG